MYSVRQLFRRKSKINALNKTWILDSGGFSELHRYGKYSFTIEQYLDIVKKQNPTYFVNMDWMCEPSCLSKTKLNIKKHIELTIENHLKIKEKYDGESSLMGVIQGYNPENYLYCIDLLKKVV